VRFEGVNDVGDILIDRTFEPSTDGGGRTAQRSLDWRQGLKKIGVSASVRGGDDGVR
jgi:hypothetical protein